jgi:hypothetical protein
MYAFGGIWPLAAVQSLGAAPANRAVGSSIGGGASPAKPGMHRRVLVHHPNLPLCLFVGQLQARMVRDQLPISVISESGLGVVELGGVIAEVVSDGLRVDTCVQNNKNWAPRAPLASSPWGASA